MLSAVNTVNLVDGLQGKLPGLNIKQRTNEPGAYTTAFSIRGFGAPLVVIDGIIRDEFFKLDPNSIKSISVLKDAAAAVYGVKAANGVVLITTKEGNANQKPTVNYSGRLELNTVTNANFAKVSNAYQYATQIVETDVYLGRTPTYTREDLQNFKDGTYPSTNWLEVAFNNHSWAQNHNLSVSGGSNKIKYFNSIGISDNGGLLKSGDFNYKKYNVLSSVVGNITDDLQISLKMDGILDQKTQPYSGNWINDQEMSSGYWIYTIMNIPTFSVYANDTPPYLTFFGYSQHPIAETTSDIGGYMNIEQKTFQSNLSLDYKVKGIDGLS
jgi:TonB-dependent SusC/RagA subfamily outer membrane receptor